MRAGEGSGGGCPGAQLPPWREEQKADGGERCLSEPQRPRVYLQRFSSSTSAYFKGCSVYLFLAN